MKKQVKKAVIPAAGLGTRFLPATKAQPKEMLPIVDTPTIQFIVEEAIASGIEEILIITSGNKRSIEDHFDKSYELEDTLEKKGKKEMLEMVQNISNMVNIHYIRQKEPKGLGHAVLCAKAFINDEPFAVLLGDDIVYTEPGQTTALGQLIDVYNQTGASVVGVQTVAKEDVNKYGIVAPSKTQKSVDGRTYKLSDMIEKPVVEEAPSQMAVLGRYVLNPEIFDLLETQAAGAGNEIQLTDAIKRLMARQQVYAYDFVGRRYDVGDKFGFVQATIDYALRDSSLHEQVENYIKQLVEEK
ncbi:UTP--glucose-1-phosphate uridylyltransferase GalU [Culicoidibacter larvae]|uniref:UTP--glucose-1-phosphate uridylyltransferase n=1 Tax=Culicoidibacter larvae TaxID=2579976 RepID=A0A5R8QDY3_9FIRM|nr:UTP--glucose-1-phosphate uridylyltransferase GalU [Culicoidibacter larvae]TLG75240.1 UTP--glucose-1-phosphate uridylyltransferase GalU [Culicoidibacter larvae]